MAARAGGLEGTLDYFPLVDVFQLISSSSRSGLLVIMGAQSKSYIYFRGGNPIHALMGEVIGDDAIYATFLVKSGSFAFNPQIPPPRFKTVRLGVQGLLMEAMRRMDEAAREPAPPPPSGDADYANQLRLADAHVQVGNLAAAKAIYEALLHANPRDREVRTRMDALTESPHAIGSPFPGPAGVELKPPSSAESLPDLVPVEGSAASGMAEPAGLEEAEMVLEGQVLESGIRVYESLLKKDPRNEELKARLDELYRLKGQIQEGARQ